MTNNTDPARALIEKWRGTHGGGFTSQGEFQAHLTTLRTCADELEDALASAPPRVPAVVDEAMVERALNAQPFASSRDSRARVRVWHLFLDERDAAEIMRAALTAALAQQPAAVDEALSHADLCRLSRVFNAHNVPGLDQDRRINEWLGKRIAAALAAQQQGGAA